MRVSSGVRRFALLASMALVLTLMGCGSESGDEPVTGGPDGGTSGSTGSIAPPNPQVDCKPLSCSERGYECGPQGDGCGKVISCGDCPQGTFCGGGGPSKCGIGVQPPGGLCKPRTCTDVGATCGKQGDGCGGTLDCGDCASPAFCGGAGASKCGLGGTAGGPVCTPKTCQELAASCGMQGDGCGNLLDCGSCVAPEFCGGNGLNHCGLGAVGGGTLCTPKTCADLGAFCGSQGDGCGNVLDCGSCVAPEFCGGNGPNKCGQGGAGGTNPCVPQTCAALNATCGQQGDGCGALLDCGSCQEPAYCGGAGANHCGLGAADGGSTCVPKTCQDLGANCGEQGDGCGGTLDCGTCTAPAFCGGNGPSKCGQGGTDGGSLCTPRTCTDINAQCGVQADGCGGTLDCGTCTAPAFCGGNGPNQCGQGGVGGAPPCTPKSCTDLGATCGKQGDGCGNTIDCGTCTSPEFCGGNGPNKCGLGGTNGNSACTPTTCTALGAQCGPQGDGCGSTLNCGTCAAPQ
jgi:hypothetical protein